MGATGGMPSVDPISSLIGLGLQLPGFVNQILTARKQRKAADKIVVPDDPTKVVSDYEKQNLANYQNAYNTGMMPGQAFQQQQILDTAAGTRSNIGRNATSAAQRLALSGSVQGQEDAANRNLTAQFGQQKMGMLSGLGNALGRMTGEEQMVFMDKLRKTQEAQAAKNKLMQSAMVNKQNAFNTIGGVGAMVGTGEWDVSKLGGMFSGMFSGGSKPGMQPAQTRLQEMTNNPSLW